MSLKVNKKSLKRQRGGMIPEQAGMQEQQPMHQMPDGTMMPGAVHGQSGQQQVDPEVTRITEMISTQMGQGAELVEVVQTLQQQQVDQNLIGQALLMGGMKEQDIMSLFQVIERNNTPSTPTEVTNDPQLLARNEQIQSDQEQVDPMTSMMPEMAMGGGTNNPGFRALPAEAQANILRHMATGGDSTESKNVNIDRKSMWYNDPTFAVAPGTPPASTNILLDTVNTGLGIKNTLFGEGKDNLGLSTGALMDLEKKQALYDKTKNLNYDVNYKPNLSDENAQAAMNWYMSAADDIQQGDADQIRLANEQKASITGVPYVEEENAMKSTAEKFSDWAESKGTDLQELGSNSLELLRNLFSKTTGNSFSYGGALPKAQGGGPVEFKEWVLQDPVRRGTAEGRLQYEDYVTNFQIAEADANFPDGIPTGGATIPPTTDELFDKIDLGDTQVMNPIMGTVNKIKQSPAFDIATGISDAAVDFAGWRNRRFDEKNYREKEDQYEFGTQADSKYGTKAFDPFSLGFYQANSGQLQGEAQKTTGYQMNFPGSPYSFGQPSATAEDGKEINNPNPGIRALRKVAPQAVSNMGYKQGGEIEVDQDTLAQLLAAGADIEIL